MAKTVAALFDKHTEGFGAVHDLVDHDFARGGISLMTQDDPPREGDTTTDRDSSEGVQEGGIGTPLGVEGLVVGRTSLAMPGIGAVSVAGPLATALRGAGADAAAGGFIGALTEMGIPEQHAHFYGEGVRRGGVLVTVVTTDATADRAVLLLAQNNPVDLSKRVEEWRQSGWTCFDPQSEADRAPGAIRDGETRREGERARTAEAGVHVRGDAAVVAGASLSSFVTSPAAAPPDPREQRTATTIPVVQEEVLVGKRAVARDVRIHTTVTEHPVKEQVQLREERVTVERRPADRPASGADQAGFQEGVIVMTETVEEPVVAKQARVVEEVVVQKDTTDHVETIHDTVRHTDVEVEQAGKERPRGDTSTYPAKQQRQAEPIAAGDEQRGVPEEEAERRAGATVHKRTGGGKKSGAGQGHTIKPASAQKRGHKGGAASGGRSSAARSASTKKTAQTRKRRAATAHGG